LEEETRRHEKELAEEHLQNKNTVGAEPTLSAAERKKRTLLEKKLRKVETILDDALNGDGPSSKEFKKLQKKKKQYLDELGGNQESSRNQSVADEHS
jgi:hypothetical protein